MRSMKSVLNPRSVAPSQSANQEALRRMKRQPFKVLALEMGFAHLRGGLYQDDLELLRTSTGVCCDEPECTACMDARYLLSLDRKVLITCDECRSS